MKLRWGNEETRYFAKPIKKSRKAE